MTLSETRARATWPSSRSSRGRVARPSATRWRSFAARSEVSAQVLETEREIARAQATAAGKPANVVERIAEGKVEKFYQEAVLVEQPFVKDPEKTVGQVIVERGGKGALELRFVRFKLGEGLGRGAEEAA